MKVSKKELQEMIQEALKEQAVPNEVTMHSVAPPKEPEKLFPTDDLDIIRKWMKQVNDLLNEMDSRKFHGGWSLGGGVSSNSRSTRDFAKALMLALRQDLSGAKQSRNQGHQKKARLR